MKINFSLFVKMSEELDTGYVTAGRGTPKVMAGEYWIRLFCFLTSIILCLLPSPSAAGVAEVSDVVVRIAGNDLYVTASFKPGQKALDDIYEGLPKEFAIYIDLFRVWEIWPNEFVLGKKIIRTLKSDLIKREYAATSSSGNLQIEKRFKDPDAMIAWTINIPEIKLTAIRGLEPGTYFAKVTAESRLKKLPPVVGYLLPFIPEKEFTVSGSSPVFQLNAK